MYIHEPKRPQVPGEDSIVLAGGHEHQQSIAGLNGHGESLLRAEGTATGPSYAGRLSVKALLRYKWTALLVAGLVCAPMIAGTWVLILPWYSATGQIRIRPNVEPAVFRTPENGLLQFYDMFVYTEINTIRGPAILDRVLDTKDVRTTKWYSDPSGSVWSYFRPAKGPQSRLAEDLRIRRLGKTEFLEVSISAHDAASPATIVNVVLAEYLKLHNELSDRGRKERREKLRDLCDPLKPNSLTSEIAELERKAGELRRQMRVWDPEELVAGHRRRLEDANADVAALDLELAVLKLERELLESLMSGDGNSRENPTSRPGVVPEATSRPAARQAYGDDREWRELDIAVRRAELRFDGALRNMKPGHPRHEEVRQKLQEEVDLARKLRDGREKQLQEVGQGHPVASAVGGTSGPDYQMQLRALDERARILEERRKLLVKRLGSQENAFPSDFSAAQDLAKTLEEIRLKKELHAEAREKLDRLEAEGNATARVEIQARARPPEDPDSDKRIMMTAMALAFGLGAGLAAAAFRALNSSVIHEPEELPTLVRLPFLGQLPVVGQKGDDGLLRDAGLNECVRMVRTALLTRLDEKRGNVVLVSSAQGGTGKSTVALMLARSLAQSGKGVLLIDADLRRSGLSGYFQLRDQPGFMESLERGTVDESVTYPVEADGLRVMPTGKGSAGGNRELAANGAFTACMDQLRSLYDVILVDSSPILPVADARILARQVDGTILVVREQRCRRSDLVEALACLSAAGSRLLGTVFIGSFRHGGYRYAYYGGGSEK